jgi:nucleotide sugar dehydrogenase
MKISVIGCGYLGAVHAVAMAHLGHEVVGIDSDPDKISSLSSGNPTILEPGFDILLKEGLNSGNIAFATDPEAARGATVHFIGVGTPQKAHSQAADLTYLEGAIDSLLPHLRPGDVVAGKSTVPVGTAAGLEPKIRRAGACLVWNPEFLREGSAVVDTLEPDRLVYGLSSEESDSNAGREALDECYEAPIAAGVPRLTMDFATAELVKVAANSFLATKISFINAMARACDATGADVVRLAQAIGMDERIGHRFLRAGIGFGGGCLPKDIRALQARAGELDLRDSFRFLAEVERINDGQRTRTIDALAELVGGLKGHKITVLGATFKPETDDIRSSPALGIAASLVARGARVTITDPAASGQDVLAQVAGAEFSVQTDDAVAGADALILCTEWEQYNQLDPERIGGLVGERVIVDGRNALDPASWKRAGWTYRGIGRR